jgi:hypothetical protein
MEKKKNVSPSVDEAKLRIKLYNDLSAKLSGLSHEEKRIVLEEMEKYVKLIVSNVNMERRLFLAYSECVDIMFEYFYKAGQLNPNNDSFDPEIRKHINDVFITIANEHDAS